MRHSVSLDEMLLAGGTVAAGAATAGRAARAAQTVLELTDTACVFGSPSLCGSLGLPAAWQLLPRVLSCRPYPPGEKGSLPLLHINFSCLLSAKQHSRSRKPSLTSLLSA